MGGFLGTIGIGAAANVLDTVTVLLKQGRNIAGIIPDVVLSEEHNDELEITSMPVEIGAQISDHAFLRPAELVMTLAWSNSTGLLQNAVSDIARGDFKQLLADSTGDRLKDAYQIMLRLQASRKPFNVVTGKRNYTDMLIRGMSVRTTLETENSLILEVRMRHVILVATKTVTMSSTGLMSPLSSNQADPSKTASTATSGSKQLVPTAATNSLKKLGVG